MTAERSIDFAGPIESKPARKSLREIWNSSWTFRAAALLGLGGVLVSALSYSAPPVSARIESATPRQADGVIVVYDTNDAQKLNLEEYGAVKHYDKGKNFNKYSFAVVRGQAGKKQLSELSKVPEIKWTEPNYVTHLDTTPNDPMYTNGQQWYLGSGATDMARAWPTSTGETIGIIDTGCATNHDDLPKILQGDRFETLGGSIVNGGAEDVYGHGTWSQGIIEALSNNSIGIAGIIWNPNRFVCIKAMNDQGFGYLSDAALAVQLARDQGIVFLGADFDAGQTDSQLLRDSVVYFLQGGGYLFAACGNSGATSCDYPANYSQNLEGVVAVSGIDQSLKLATFSNYGSGVTFAEPAVQICSTVPTNSYACHDGTSGSIPIALGIATAAHNLNPTMSRAAFLQFLKNNAVDLGSTGWDSSFGWGMLTSKNIFAGPAPTPTSAPTRTPTLTPTPTATPTSVPREKKYLFLPILLR